MTSQGSTEMANDKVSATFSGSDDWPREADGSPKTKLTNDEAKQVMANWPRRNGKASISAYAMGHANGQNRLIPEVRDYDCAYRWYNGQMDVHSTGEHVWKKITEDDLYADPMRPLQHGDLLTDRQAELTSDERYAEQAHSNWTPKLWELSVAMGIVLFIIAVFWFVTTYYPM